MKGVCVWTSSTSRFSRNRNKGSPFHEPQVHLWFPRGSGRLTLMTLMDCLISSSFFVLSLIRCLSSDLFFPRLLCRGGSKNQDLQGLSNLAAISHHPRHPPAGSIATGNAHHLLLPLVVSGDDVVGFVRAVGARGADAGVVRAAVAVQEALVLLAELLLQVERGFDEPVRGQRLDLRRTVAGESEVTQKDLVQLKSHDQKQVW